MIKPTLYIMCGLPYSGKTTFAKEMADKNGYVLVSIDDVREKMGFFWGSHEAEAEDWKRIFNEAYTNIITALQSSQTVIYDSANQDKFSRNRLKQLADSVGCDSKIIFIDTPREVILQRRQSNLENPTRSHIPQVFFDAAIATFEPLTPDENILDPASLAILDDLR